MGATNHTTNYSLSQFEPTDKPAWLQDYNGDMSKIDAGINTAQLAADAAQLTANTADGKADSANSAITNTITPAIGTLQTSVTNQGGAINTINALIGNGTPTTTDQTIIGAINEINANLGDVEYESISFAYTTKYSDIIDLLETSIAKGKIPHVVCDIQMSGGIDIINAVFQLARTNYTGGNEINWSCVITASTIAGISTSTTGSPVTVTGGTATGIANGKLYY